MTTILQAFEESKAKSNHSILLFSMGAFYEAFYTDAKLIAKILGLTLMTRDHTSPNPVPMTGFPHHQLDKYVSQLKAYGHRVAVVGPLEDGTRKIQKIYLPKRGKKCDE